MAQEFKYEIVHHLAVLSEVNNTTKELNVIKYNGSPAKYDLRTWKQQDGEKKMLKGITLTTEEVVALRDALNNLTDTKSEAKE